jgi:actin
MIQIIFETFNAPSFYLALQPALALYTTGRTTGVVLDCGHDVTHAVPIHEGKAIQNAIIGLNLGGRDITEYLARMQPFQYGSNREKETVRRMIEDMKERMDYVALDFEAETQKAILTTECNARYTMPDGDEIVIAKERFLSSELLFKSNLIDIETEGVDQTLFESIMKFDIDIREDLYANITLSGGSTMLKGFSARIEKEISRLAPPMMKINILAPWTGSKYASWIGGSIFASMETFPQIVIPHTEYNEVGLGIIHRKCF